MFFETNGFPHWHSPSFLASEFNKSWTRYFSHGPSERFNRRGLRGESKKVVKCNDGGKTFFVFDLDH